MALSFTPPKKNARFYFFLVSLSYTLASDSALMRKTLQPYLCLIDMLSEIEFK